MKKTLLVGMNAKYIHSNLAIHSISKYAMTKGVSLELKEYTINQSLDHIMSDIYDARPEVLGLSCYIWNMEMMIHLVRELKKVMSDLVIFLGGPEVSYEWEQWFDKLPEVDYIVSGEGEVTVTHLVDAINKGDDPVDIAGVVTRGSMDKYAMREPMSMDQLPFIYDGGLEAYKHRIMYYETSRGCPFNCQYCLSSVEKGLRFRSLNLVFEELSFFLEAKVPQVKFVDRTFNAKRERTKAIWQYIIDHDNGITNFHFEIAADLLTDDVIEVLGAARVGLVQLEIGVQSTHDETLDIIKRFTKFDLLTKQVQKIQSLRNTHLHLDLIAGLPKESYGDFRKSFNDVFGLRPDQLQLGFLKVLRGSGMKEMAGDYGLKYRDYAPYEILETDDLTYGEMEDLKMLEHVLEIYYNSGYYKHTLSYVMKSYESPFDFFEALGGYYKSENGHMLKHAKLSLYNILRDFGQKTVVNKALLDETLTYDLLLQEKIKKYPDWYQPTVEEEKLSRNFFRNEGKLHKYMPELTHFTGKQLSRSCHLKVLSHSGLLEQKIEGERFVVVFDYTKRNPLNNEPITLVLSYDECLEFGNRVIEKE